MTVNFRGYLFNDAGVAVSGATVDLLDTGTSDRASGTSADTTDSNGLWNFDTVADGQYDVKVTYGGSVRYLRWDDQIHLKEIDVRNNTGNTTPALTAVNLTNNASNQVAVFRSDRGTGNAADGDEVYLSFNLRNSNNEEHEFARMTADAVDVTNGEEDGQIRFSVSVDGTMTDVFTINSSESGGTDMTLDVSGDLTLDADGGDVFFKDGGTTFGSATNNSGNLIIKSGTTTAATFSGANVTFAGTVDATTDFTLGDTVITDGVITDSSGLQLAANLDIDGTADISGDVTLSGGADGALRFTNAGENSIKIPDNQASALIIEEADNAYITFVTTNSSEAITVAKATTFSAGIADSGTIAAGTWNGTAIATSYIADNAVTLAKMASGTDGNIISYDASGNPVAIATGSDGQVLTSTGAGSPPAFESLPSSSTAADDIGTGDGAVNIVTTVGNITIDAQATDADVIIKVDDNGSPVTAVTFDGSDEGNAIFVNDVQLKSDGALLEFGADLDTTLTHTDGTGLTLNSTNKLTFGDAASFIQQSADGTLRIDGEAIIDLNASTRVDVSGGLTVGGVVDITDATDASDATGDTGALRTEGGASIAKKLYVGTDLDVDGTTNLDAVDIDGNVQMNGTFTLTAVFADMNDYANPAMIIEKSQDTCLSLHRSDSSGTQHIVRFYDGSSGGSNATERGSITIASGATAYNTSSDYRLKENTTAISDGLARVKALKPYRFNFKTDAETTLDGFLAHEAAEVVPESVSGDKDGTRNGKPEYQGMDSSKLVPILVAALKEIDARVTALE